MERPSDTPPLWCNPQTLHRDFDDQATALESEVFDLHSTIDPSHIIHLIRQLLPATGKHIHSFSAEVTRNNDCSNPAEDSKCKLDIIVQNVTGSADGQLKHDSLSASDVEDEERIRRKKEEGVNSDSAVLGNSLQSAARSPEVSLTNAIAVGNGKDEDYEDKVEKSKQGDTEEKTEYEDSREEAGCVLWDLAANQIHADFLVENQIIDVLLELLRTAQSDRMREICLGILGNLACHAKPEKIMVETEGFVSMVVKQLFVNDAPSLSEACRLLSAGLHSEVVSAWVTALKGEEVMKRILWVVANTMNSQLLEKSTELLLAMVDSRIDAASGFLPTLLRLDLLDLLTDLLACEVTAINEGTSSCGDTILDIVLQIAEVLSLVDDVALQLAANRKLFSLACQVVRLSSKDEIGPSGITATVLIANLLMEEAHLIHEVSHDEVLVSHLLALVPSLGDDSGARNALWSILGRIFRCLVATKNEPPCSSMIAVLTDSCSLLLDDLDDHQEDDIREDEGGALPASHTMANNSRGLQAKLTTVSNMAQIMEEWAAVVTRNTVNHDAPSVEMVQNAYISLRKHVTANGTMPEFEKPPCENGSLHSG